jgi:hypothetical protein
MLVLQVFNLEKEENYMKTRKTVIAVLTAALVTVFIIGCVAPMDSPNFGTGVTPSGGTTPDGKVLVRLNLVNSDSGARTVIPNTSGYDDLTDTAQFASYNLIITDSTNADVTPGAPGAFNGLSYAQLTAASVALEPTKTYKFTVIAFKGAASNGSNKLAMGSSNITVSSSNKTVSITLKEIVDGVGSGTFAVTSSNKASYDTVALSLFSLVDGSPAFADELDSGTGADVEDVDLKGYSGIFTIKSGYYRMNIALTKAGFEPVTVVEIVHIYEGFPSVYSATLPTLRSNLHTITYNYSLDGGDIDDAMASENVAHGGNITNLTAEDSIPPVGHIFGAWYDAVDSGAVDGNVVDGSTKIIKPLTLYAKWEPTSVNVTFTSIAIGWTSPVVPVFTGSTASYSQSDSSIDIEVVLYNDDSFITASIIWHVDGAQYATNTTSINITGDVDSALNWYQAGVHTITFEAIVFGGTTRYSGEWTISCNP